MSVSYSTKKRYALKFGQYLWMRMLVPLNREEAQAWRTGPRVFANSIPKAGTNLVKRLFNLTPRVVPRWTYHLDRHVWGCRQQLRHARKGQVVTAHLPFERQIHQTLCERGFRRFFMVRDIRDVASSNVFYVMEKDLSHPLHEYFRSLVSNSDRLTASIQGVPARFADDGQDWGTIGERVNQYLGWLDDPDCLTVRFEDLIGEAGGGSREAQLKAVKDIMCHLKVPLSEAEVERITDATFFRGARTFRKGQIGDWRNHFNDEHVALFKEVAGDVLIRLGYETDHNW